MRTTGIFLCAAALAAAGCSPQAKPAQPSTAKAKRPAPDKADQILDEIRDARQQAAWEKMERDADMQDLQFDIDEANRRLEELNRKQRGR